MPKTRVIRVSRVIHISDIVTKSLDICMKTISERRLNDILNTLISCGLLREEFDKFDGRLKRYFAVIETKPIDVAKLTLERFMRR